MIKTPKWMLGEGYPLCTDKARLETARIWERAFELHSITHDFQRDKKMSEQVINPDYTAVNYCECYLRAWLEFSEPEVPTSEPKEEKYIELDPFEERII